jgi:hypothetical protein
MSLHWDELYGDDGYYRRPLEMITRVDLDLWDRFKRPGDVLVTIMNDIRSAWARKGGQGYSIRIWREVTNKSDQLVINMKEQ